MTYWNLTISGTYLCNRDLNTDIIKNIYNDIVYNSHTNFKVMTTHTHTHIYIHTHIHTHAYTHTHTHTHDTDTAVNTFFALMSVLILTVYCS